MKVRHLTWPRLGALAAGLLRPRCRGSSARCKRSAGTSPKIMLIVADDLGYGDTVPMAARGPRHADAVDRSPLQRGHDALLTLRRRAARPEGLRCRPAASPTAAA